MIRIVYASPQIRMLMLIKLLMTMCEKIHDDGVDNA